VITSPNMLGPVLVLSLEPADEQKHQRLLKTVGNFETSLGCCPRHFDGKWVWKWM